MTQSDVHNDQSEACPGLWAHLTMAVSKYRNWFVMDHHQAPESDGWESEDGPTQGSILCWNEDNNISIIITAALKVDSNMI